MFPAVITTFILKVMLFRDNKDVAEFSESFLHGDNAIRVRSFSRAQLSIQRCPGEDCVYL